MKKFPRLNPKTLTRFLPLGVASLTLTGIFSISSISGLILDGGAVPQPRTAGGIAPLFAPQGLAWTPQILRWSADYGLDPNLTATVMQIESCGDPHAVSRSGAQGLFQVMPYHFSEGEDMQDPETNARRGLVYLAESLLISEGDIRRTFAGYNGGHGVIGRDPLDWSAETVRYAYWGEGIYRDAAAWQTSSQRLEEWLAAGGKSLCGKACKREKRIPQRRNNPRGRITAPSPLGTATG